MLADATRVSHAIFTGGHIERPQAPVHHRSNDFILIHGDSTIHHAAANAGLPDLAVDLGIGVPHFFASVRVDGVHDAPGRDAIQDAVVDQGCSLLPAAIVAARNRGDVVIPCQTQPAHVGVVDLGERAIALLRPAQVVSDPFSRIPGGVLQRGIVDLFWLLRHHGPGGDDHSAETANRPCHFPCAHLFGHLF